jgi:indole-3-glycerol phosphate synthase
MDDKRSEVAARRRAKPLVELEAEIAGASATRPFADALRHPGGDFSIIAEVKKASPSKGLIREDFDAVAIGMAYAKGGAVAISCLTDEKYFQGRLEHLTDIRRSVGVPVLRKDFICDPYQVVESRAAGADAILLILAAVSDDRLLVDLAGLSTELGMGVLWEVHDREELDRLRRLPLEPEVIGVNNRNLRTFEVDLETTRALLPEMPEGAAKVSESGFSARAELEVMREWGVDAFLIGESLMRAPDPGRALADLAGKSGGRA